jgi:AraC-like DNA-binding protein
MGRVLQRFVGEPRPQHEYSQAHLDRLWQQAAERDPAIGLRLFETFTPADWHVLAHLSQFSATVADGLHQWRRYARLASDMDEVRLSFVDGGVAIELLIDAPARLQRFIVEHYAVMVLGLVRRGTGHANLSIRTEFRHARPTHHRCYNEILGRAPRFAAPRTCLYLDADHLALPMRQHHPVLVDLLCESLERRLVRLQQFEGWAGRVAQRVRADLRQGRGASIESAAAALHLSPRTLRRYLSAQGIRFRELLDVVRAELEQSLELDGLRPEQIAAHLGYVNTTTYMHARKRWQRE